MKHFILSSLLITLVLAYCQTANPPRAQYIKDRAGLEKRASADLNCDKQLLSYQKIAPIAYAITGCGKVMIYVYSKNGWVPKNKTTVGATKPATGTK